MQFANELWPLPAWWTGRKAGIVNSSLSLETTLTLVGPSRDVEPSLSGIYFEKECSFAECYAYASLFGDPSGRWIRLVGPYTNTFW